MTRTVAPRWAEDEREGEPAGESSRVTTWVCDEENKHALCGPDGATQPTHWGAGPIHPRRNGVLAFTLEVHSLPLQCPGSALGALGPVDTSLPLSSWAKTVSTWSMLTHSPCPTGLAISQGKS